MTTPNFASGNTHPLQLERCYSKMDNKQLFLIGTGNQWRKYIQATVDLDTRVRYLSCYTCVQIQKNERLK